MLEVTQMVEISILRGIDHRISEMEKTHALHQQALQYQLRGITDSIEALKKQKPPGIGSRLMEILTSPKALKFLSGGGLTAAGYLCSRLIG